MDNTSEKISIDDLNFDKFQKRPLQNKPKNKTTLFSFFLTFVITFCFWLLFSGKFDFFHMSLGVASCLIVSATSSRLLFPNPISLGLLKCWLKFAGYLPWLFYQILLSNLYVLYLTFHPKMMDLINPKTIKFKSKLKSDVSRTTFANSITLTPGTITIHADVMGKFAVHCIDDKSGIDLPGKMENKIAKVFDEL